MIWKIATAGNHPTVGYAAEELKKYIEKMDATQEVAILSFDGFKPELDSVLWLGVCDKTKALVKEPLYDDAVSIEVKDGKGHITGSNPRSVLIGVYRYLRELGCAFVRPGKTGEIIPALAPETVPVSLTEIPSYRHRGVCIEGAVNYDHVTDMIDWLPKVGMNEYFNQFNSPFTFYNRWYTHKRNPGLGNYPLSAEEIRGLRDQSIRQIKKRDLLYQAAGHGWTCEPFGIPGEQWEILDTPLTDEQKSVLAQVDGKRELWEGVPLNTNLCYSNPVVRKTIADAVVEYCRKTPQIDYLQLWLADGTNNHCECEECVKKQPSDWYVTLLNEVDAAMTEANLPQRVVFLIYVDLLWAPQRERLNNPERFVMMFAPITRTYSQSIADCGYFDEKDLPAYKRNQLSFPQSVEENIAWLRKWQEQFQGDGFDFDYHFMWDHFKDPGYYRMAEILFKDMQGLHKIGLNGMISCQAQRVFFPTGLGMVAMASALWDEHCSFEDVSHRYFNNAFGQDGALAENYLRQISDAFDPVYIRGEKPLVDENAVLRLNTLPEIIGNFRQTVAQHANDTALLPNVRRSWELLNYHADLCLLLYDTFLAAAEGNADLAEVNKQKMLTWAQKNEQDLAEVFDMFVFFDTYEKRNFQG